MEKWAVRACGWLAVWIHVELPTTSICGEGANRIATGHMQRVTAGTSHVTLRTKKLSHARSFFDVQNAFPSQSSHAISAALDTVARPVDRTLWEQRYKEATVRVSDGRAEADFRPRSGTMQGDGPSAELFLEPYHRQLDKWLQSTQVNDPRRLLFATCEILFASAEQDLSLSSYANDVSRITLGRNPQELHLALEVVNTTLDRWLWEIDLVQNIGKQEHVVFFGGQSSVSNYRAVYETPFLPGKTVSSTRYLGARVHYAGKNQDEVNFRLQVAKRNWARMAHFWHRSFSSKRGKVLVYTALVHSALLSGLETFVLEQSKYKQLNALVLRHGRKLMQGKGCSKQVLEDGSIKYTACKLKTVWKWLRLCPCELELQIRRLAWYQQLARDIHKHKCVLMAIFGKLGFESQDTVDSGGKILPSANAWAQQFSTDIHQGLCKMDAGQGLLDLLQDCVVLVFTEFLPEFLALDMSEIRRTFDPVCIPPPGWVEPDTFPDDSDNDASDVDRSFVCDRTLADGTPCLQAFPTFQALAAHKSSTKGGTHDDISPIAFLAITNACPFCKNIFSSTQSARNHISRSLKEGRCSGSGSHVFFKIETPSDLRCRCCIILFDSVHQLLDHVTTHVVLQRPEVQQ